MLPQPTLVRFTVMLLVWLFCSLEFGKLFVILPWHISLTGTFVLLVPIAILALVRYQVFYIICLFVCVSNLHRRFSSRLWHHHPLSLKIIKVIPDGLHSCRGNLDREILNDLYNLTSCSWNPTASLRGRYRATLVFIWVGQDRELWLAWGELRNCNNFRILMSFYISVENLINSCLSSDRSSSRKWVND